MLNGNGKAVGGSKNYWDLCYGGVCDKTLDNQRLSGAKGDLTDGVVSALNWASVETVAGSGPFVGWHRSHAPNVTIDFQFDTAVDIDAVSIHADDANGAGGVSLPGSVTISWAGGSRTFEVLDPVTATPQWLTFAGLGVSGASSVRVQLTHRNWWLFVDEVRFAGREAVSSGPNGNAVPEPSSLALALVAVLGVGLRARRRGH